MKAYKLLFLCLLLTISSDIVAQEVPELKYEKAVNYIIYQITQTSLEDNGKVHLDGFKIINQDRDYSFERLVVFLKTRETGVLTQNLELIYDINTYKEKYDQSISASEFYTLLTDNLFREAFIQNFKLKHENSFPAFENNINEYLTYLFELNETTVEVIDDGMGEIVMGETESSSSKDNIDRTVILPPQEQRVIEEEEVIIPPATIKEKPSIIQPETPIFDNYSPFKTEDGEPIFSLSSWLFRISLLCAAMAVLLYVLLPYYEKREKSKVKKPGGDIHPTVLSLQAELQMVENNNRIMRENIRKLHLDLDEHEDTFTTY